ncbi:hypothetical protein ILYODFUR_017238 [Ilyodon furcidens]|uniref:MHC class I-like antigen recognition-like domain-containing protein n=1 Tax=Ilyodon furcidens TaxID=33524 RepID=A0ABV0USQ5_9TELE
MKTLILLLLLVVGMHSAAAVSHSLQYFYTVSTGMETFPQFVAVGIVDGEQIDYYDSVSEKNVLKQTWMEGVRDEKRITDVRKGIQQTFKANVGVAMQRFNQTTGVHIVQEMRGCEWDEETGKVTGSFQFGYDGEDFATWDTGTNTWIPAKQQAEITTDLWNNDKAKLESDKNYINHLCPGWLRNYVSYGRSYLMRTEDFLLSSQLPRYRFLPEQS